MYAKEVGRDIVLVQRHMTLGLEWLWGVTFLVIRAQPAMAMKNALFSLTCVVAENICKSKVSSRYDSNWYLSFIIRKFDGDEKDERTSTDFSWVLKGGWLGYGTRSYFLFHFRTSSIKIVYQTIISYFSECIRLLYWGTVHFECTWSCPISSIPNPSPLVNE